MAKKVLLSQIEKLGFGNYFRYFHILISPTEYNQIITLYCNEKIITINLKNGGIKRGGEIGNRFTVLGIQNYEIFGI